MSATYFKTRSENIIQELSNEVDYWFNEYKKKKNELENLPWYKITTKQKVQRDVIDLYDIYIDTKEEYLFMLRSMGVNVS